METTQDNLSPEETSPEEQDLQPTEGEQTDTETNEEAPPSTDEDLDAKALEEGLSAEQLKGLTPDQVEKRVKGMQASYTRKMQALAEQQRDWEAKQSEGTQRLTQIESQYKELSQLALEVMRDPSKLDAYRQVYGPKLGIQAQNQTPQAEEIPDFETKEQLVAWMKQREQQLAQTLTHQLRNENQSLFKQHTEEQGWNAAHSKVSTDPFYQRYQDVIQNYVSNPANGFIARYQQGQLTQEQVLREGMEAIRQRVSEDVKRAKEEVLGTVAKKKAATTQRPSRPVQTQRVEPKSREEIIAGIQERLGAF